MDSQQPTTRYERNLARKEEKEQERARREKFQLIKRLSVWLVAFAAIGGAIFGMVRSGEINNVSQTASAIAAVSPQDQISGNKNAKVVLVEYSDFQCPACRAYYPVVKELAKEYENKIEFVYRNFPLRNNHKNADLASRAAEAAGKQGKFWEMHDLLFERQDDWAESSQALDLFKSYAALLKLDVGRFSTDIDSQEIKAKVDGDFNDGLRAGVNATPTFFLNGKVMPQPRSLDDFKHQIDTANPGNS